ncbi:hypothetical protein MNBD_GAMMA12-235 [hydrothermal vent metagenome]|uniref:Uncharacterized protein n=1 Tax=hydrothermal vent metagenome TaxID=652676 RepID=A0A3B0YFX4_9ZZZZ
MANRNATPRQRVAQNNINGNVVSNNIAARFPGSDREVRLVTPNGGVRFVDVLTPEGLAIESKVGRTSLSNTVRIQASKDIELFNDPFSLVNSLRFEFSRSPITGKVGPTPQLEIFLRENGFEIIIND